jgi:hypothetical protein
MHRSEGEPGIGCLRMRAERRPAGLRTAGLQGVGRTPAGCAGGPGLRGARQAPEARGPETGSAPGLSGWMTEHLRAATGTSPSATTAILALMNLFISGILPDIPSLHASALIALAKPARSAVGPVVLPRGRDPAS